MLALQTHFRYPRLKPGACAPYAAGFSLGGGFVAALLRTARLRPLAAVARVQRGISLIEMVVGMAVNGLLLTVLVSVVFTVGQGVDRNNTKITVFRGIENAASFLGGDVAMAKFTDLVDAAAAVGSMTLEWTDYYGDTNFGHKSIYSLSGGNLQRNYDGAVSTLAKNVSSAGFSRSGSLITVTFTVSDTEGSIQFSEPRTYRFFMRAQSG